MFAFKEVKHVAYKSAKKESLLDWNKKLGQTHFARVKEVLNWEEISYEPSPEEFEMYMLTKATSKPFKSSATISSKPLELVHSDMAFFSEKSLSGKTYYVTFIANFTHHTALYFFKSKCKVFKAFKYYKAFSEK
jgi:hypothetical protein